MTDKESWSVFVGVILAGNVGFGGRRFISRDILMIFGMIWLIGSALLSVRALPATIIPATFARIG